MIINRITRIILALIICLSFGYAKEMSETLRQRVSPNFVGISLQNALRVFANQYSLNMIISGEVKGTVTLQLTDVTLEDALNTMLMANGCHFILENNVIIVKPFALTMNGELTTRVYNLKYLDSYKLMKTLEPLLSGKGKMEALLSESDGDAKNQRSNILVVTDLWENLKKIDQIVEQMDRPQQQLQIAVWLVERITGDEKRVGIDFPKSFEASLTGAETNAPITQAGQGQSGGERTLLSAWYELPTGPEKLHLGVLTFDKLKATLDILAADKRSRLVSNPKVITMNNKKAVIKIATTIPIPEISRGISGDLYSYKEKDVSMLLEVTPVIGDSGQITLDVHPILEEIVGYTGLAEAPQPITSKREVKTTVLVKDGETVVIGGLLKDSKTESTSKVWLLGDIPLIGYLFRHVSIINEKKDLLIFITTKIM